MGRMDSLYKTTVQLVQVLTKEYKTVDQRTEIISKVNKLIERREEILQEIHPPYTKEEEIIGTKVVQLDKQISEKMDLLYREIQDDLKQLRKKKNTNKTYINPYQNMSTVDGMYLDNKL